MSNYYKYYHLRASPISKCEQPNSYSQSGQQYHRYSDSKSPIRGYEHQIPYSQISQQPLSYSGNKIQQETSPWRNLPSSSQQVQQQIASNSYTIGDKTLQHLSLEKQNECLRKEKSELENQIQKLKLYYTKQTTLDQQELMRYEREKVSLAEKLREMDELLTNLQEKYEKEMNSEKGNNKKQRQEWENKIERITSYYNEQLTLKQEEIHKTKNKLQLSDINITDLCAKLKMFEQTNQDLRIKWDEDIKNFGHELESLNQQLLNQRFRNDELERIQKLNKTASTNSSNPTKEQLDNNSNYIKEIENLKNQNLELKNRNFELEKKLKMFENQKMSEGDIQNNIFKDKLEQKILESEKLKVEHNKKVSEIEILIKDLKALQSKLVRSEKDNADKDILVQQMMAHIELIEKQNKEFKAGENINEIEEKLNQLHYENQIQKQELEFFGSELERITNRNNLLEEQLYQPETQANSHRLCQLLEKQIDKIDMKCNQIKLDLHKKEESFYSSQRGNYASVENQKQAFDSVQKEVGDLTNEIQKAKVNVQQQKQQISNDPNKATNINHYQPFATNYTNEEQRARQVTANFSPDYQQRQRNLINATQNDINQNKAINKNQQISPYNDNKTKIELNNQHKDQTSKSPYQNISPKQEIPLQVQHQRNTPTDIKHQNAENSQPQTFSSQQRGSFGQLEIKNLEDLIKNTKQEKEIQQNDREAACQLMGSQGSPSQSNNPKPLHQQLKELSDQFAQKDIKTIHPMNLTPKVTQQKQEQKTIIEEGTFMDSFRAQQEQQPPLQQQQDHIVRLNDIQQTESYVAEKTTPIRQQQKQQVTTPPPQPKQYEVPQQQKLDNYKIEYLKTPKINQQLIELDIMQILKLGNQIHSEDDIVRSQFDKKLEGTEVFDIIVGFIGVPRSGKSTVINSICKEDWDIETKTESCSRKLQIFRYSCMNKKVGLCESDLIADQSYMHFICNFAQAIVFFFSSWEISDERIFVDYIKLLQSENNFASECIVIHSNSEQLSVSAIEKMTYDLTKLQDGLYRGKVDGKLKKINVYHIMLHNYNDKTQKKSIFEETIAVCRGTIIGKITTNKEKVDVFKRVNKFLI